MCAEFSLIVPCLHFPYDQLHTSSSTDCNCSPQRLDSSVEPSPCHCGWRTWPCIDPEFGTCNLIQPCPSSPFQSSFTGIVRQHALNPHQKPLGTPDRSLCQTNFFPCRKGISPHLSPIHSPRTSAGGRIKIPSLVTTTMAQLD